MSVHPIIFFNEIETYNFLIYCLQIVEVAIPGTLQGHPTTGTNPTAIIETEISKIHIPGNILSLRTINPDIRAAIALTTRPTEEVVIQLVEVDIKVGEARKLEDIKVEEASKVEDTKVEEASKVEDIKVEEASKVEATKGVDTKVGEDIKATLRPTSIRATLLRTTVEVWARIKEATTRSHLRKYT